MSSISSSLFYNVNSSGVKGGKLILHCFVVQVNDAQVWHARENNGLLKVALHTLCSVSEPLHQHQSPEKKAYCSSSLNITGLCISPPP